MPWKGNVLIGLPSFSGNWEYETVLSLERMFSLCSAQNVSVCPARLAYQPFIDTARQLLAERAVEESSWLLFVDSDMVFPPYALSSLMQKATEEKASVVGGLYFHRAPPFSPMVFKKDEDGFGFIKKNPFPNTGVMEVDAVGTGMMLIESGLFAKMPKPWFAHPWQDKTQTFLGEDLYFCQKAKQYGAKILVDFDVRCGHVGRYVFQEQDHYDYEQWHREHHETGVNSPNQEVKKDGDIKDVPRGTAVAPETA